MDIPSNIIDAVKQSKPTKTAPKWVKESSKRVLHAIGNGLRTAQSIANALNEPKAKIVSRLWHLKDSGLVHGVKKEGSLEYKYYLTTDKPTLDKLDLTPKKRKYTKRKVTTRTANPIQFYDDDGVNTGNTFNTPPKLEPLTPLAKNLQAYAKELETKLTNVTNKLAQLELALTEKEKEVWTLECEVFDKKAVIAYLESKLSVVLAKGVGL